MPYVRGTFTGEEPVRLPDSAVCLATVFGPSRGGQRIFARKSKRSSGWFIVWANLVKTGTSSQPMMTAGRSLVPIVWMGSEQQECRIRCAHLVATFAFRGRWLGCVHVSNEDL